MKWQQLASLIFGILAIIYGWIQVKTHNSRMLVFVAWTLSFIGITGLLIYRFRDKKQKNPKDEQKE